MEDLVLYDEALEMKDIGFDEPCIFIFDTNKVVYCDLHTQLDLLKGRNYNGLSYRGCSAPTYAQCFRWFRKKYQFSHSIHRYWDDGQFLGFYRMIESFDGETIINTETFKEYEEAELACLRELIKIVKTKLGK